MFRKDFYKLLLLSIFCLAGATLAFSQTAPISGRVVLKKADNTTVPVEGALVEVYRVDIKGTGPTDKTSKKGVGPSRRSATLWLVPIPQAAALTSQRSQPKIRRKPRRNTRRKSPKSPRRTRISRIRMRSFRPR
jgi:hypothetical protein